MTITAVVNRPMPSRIQLLLGNGISGPLFNVVLGMFDPRRDVTVYNGGKPVTISSFTWDPVRNRYLLFMNQEMDLDQPIQIIHHIPNPPFVEYNENPDLMQVAPGQDPDVLADPTVGG